MTTINFVGDSPCVGSTHIGVWMIALMTAEGLTPEAITQQYPLLTVEDVAAALQYAADHQADIEAEIIANME